MILYTIGYGRWPVATRMARLIESLKSAGVTILIDTRHSPCASQLQPGTYGPKEWNLQAGSAGLAHRLGTEGIDYRWLVELGNPQKNDPAMTILREQLASRDSLWPVNRGLLLLRDTLLKAEPCAVLCACADALKCHRTVIATEMSNRFPELNLEIVHLPL